ncbi:phospholipase A1 member A isoform X2 [Leucoraja erinacea]|uniref:phospholipase A1 member A isoform X2 n=1 Tax=Leucoraja erinaceus TaxID=7782 RepID=UPI002453C232|nr:phospholipase A1 member A isoform X2 [Leucoraja erinacea]
MVDTSAELADTLMGFSNICIIKFKFIQIQLVQRSLRSVLPAKCSKVEQRLDTACHFSVEGKIIINSERVGGETLLEAGNKRWGSLAVTMADHLSTALLLATLLTVLSFTAVSGSVVENCSDFQPYSWWNMLWRSQHQVHFLLLTRGNADCAQVISRPGDIGESNFNASRPTKIIMHGFRLTGSKPSWVDSMAKELIHAMDVNVVTVDWIIGATALYTSAVKNMDTLGVKIVSFIQTLVRGSTRESFHLIGISLGAHVAGYVGQMFDGKLGRITGLDPAGPKFSRSTGERRLDASDALFVEAIHSDSDNFGISQPVGHLDFYLNDGNDQPGCSRSSRLSVYQRVTCDHMRAVYLYISSIKNPCPLVAFPCQTYEQFTNGDCADCHHQSLTHCPRIGLLDHAGLHTDIQPRDVKAFLMTSSHIPFCAKHFLVEVFLGEVGPHQQRVDVIFLSSNYTHLSKLQISISNKHSKMKKVIAHDQSIEDMASIALKLSSSWRRKPHTIHIEEMRVTELPLNHRDRPSRCIYNMVIYKALFKEFGACLSIDCSGKNAAKQRCQLQYK